MSRLLVVEVAAQPEYREPHYQLLREYGASLYFLLTDERFVETYAPRSRLAEARADAVCREAERWHAEVCFDAVVAIDESSVVPGALVARSLGLPGITPEAARNSRNKYLMRQAHHRNGAPHPRFELADSLPLALTLGEKLGYPLVLKPTLGSGSEHVYRLDEAAELERSFEAAWRGISVGRCRTTIELPGAGSGPRSLLLEEFLDGSEHCLEATVWDRELLIGSIADRLSVELKTFDHDLYSTPTSLSGDQVEQVRRAVLQGAEAQGIERGVVHAEVRHHQGRPHLVEIAPRIGGGSLFRMSRIAYGHCPLWSTLQVALGHKPDFRELDPSGEVAVGLTMTCDAGRIERLEVPEEVAHHPGVFNLKLSRQPGDLVRRPPLGNDILGYLGTKGSDLDEALDLADQLYRKIHLEIVPAPEVPSRDTYAATA